MQTPQAAPQLLCVNCNIRINTLLCHLVFELDTRVISMICEWNSSIIITEEDYICEACYQLALQHINIRLPNESGASSSRGHIHICMLCGSSLLRRRRDLIVRQNASPLQQAIRIPTENRIAPQQASASDHVCHPCWLRLKRSVMRDNYEQQAQPESQAEPEQLAHPELQTEPVPQEGPEPQPQKAVGSINSDHDEQAYEVPGVINLPNYRRAANTASHCIFYGCQNVDLRRISDITFPYLEYNELILFALGTYQIRQAKSYYGEHIRFHGGYRIEVCRENINTSQYSLRGSADNSLIRGKIKSRHVSRKIYYVYLVIENNVSGRAGIVEYCCNCLVGKRTIGCCTHVMTLVWYLGWARHQPTISAPAEFLDAVVVRENDE